jgi:stage II sporulation protein D
MIDNTGLVFAQEPEIKVGVIEGVRELTGRFNGPFRLDDGRMFTGHFSVRTADGKLIFTDQQGAQIEGKKKLCFRPEQGAPFSLDDVTIGARFHWERKQQQTFRGDLLLMSSPGRTLTAVNRLRLEDYLASVISSEMSATAPLEMLKAHTVASRSWLMAMLQRRGKTVNPGADRREASEQTGEIMRWYGREDHTRFDVCADDHCQRYQGITKIIADQAAQAVRSTRGVFLVYDHAICDARYHKACGGRTDNFENTWAHRYGSRGSKVDADPAGCLLQYHGCTVSTPGSYRL